jgi:hypothetical protein
MPRDNVERGEEAGDVHLQTLGARSQALPDPEGRKEGASGRSIFLIKGLVYGLLNLETLGDSSQALLDSDRRKEGASGKSPFLLKGYQA